MSTKSTIATGEKWTLYYELADDNIHFFTFGWIDCPGVDIVIPWAAIEAIRESDQGPVIPHDPDGTYGRQA